MRILIKCKINAAEKRIKEKTMSALSLHVPSTTNTRAVREVSSHFEYLENRSRGLDVTWQPVRRHFKADSLIKCNAHAVPLPCRAANGLECVFPI